MENLLFFKAYQPSAQPQGADRTWIHPNGRMAAVLDGVSGCSNASAAADRCLNFLRDSSPDRLLGEPLDQVLKRMHADLLSVDSGLMCVAALVRYRDDGMVEAAWAGNPRLYLIGADALDPLSGAPQIHPLKMLGMPEDFGVEMVSFPLEPRSGYLLCTDGLDHGKLGQAVDRMHSARTDAGWLLLGEECARERDWAFLVFPVERSLSYLNPEWPYNPFVGPQEEYSHEKHGLGEIAEALFRDPDFLGFRIVGGVTITRANSTRRPDGVLVSPFGVVLLELKDHDASVTLHCGKKSSLQVDTGGGNFRTERNPVEKVGEMMPSFATYQLTPAPLAPLKTQLAKIGAVIFTNPRVQVNCISATGVAGGLPYQAGDVLVVAPTQLGPALRTFSEKAMQKKGPFLDRETIEAICANLVVQAVKNMPSASSQIEVGAFLVEAQPLVEESTPYFQLHRGRFRNRDRGVLVKRFPLTTMGKGTSKEEMERLGREAHVLSLLNRVPGVQQCHHSEQGEDCLWVVLEDVEGVSLPKWLGENPDRSERLKLLRNLAGTLEELAEQNIVHRALNPSNVLVQRRGGIPLLTNFELCRLEDVATLPMAGRRLLDAKFIPEEVNTPGAAVKPVADVYSFGKLACYVLSSDRSLPFGTPMEQATFVRQRGAWEKLAAALALSAEGARQLQRMLSPHPDKRPVGAELVQIVEGWS